MSAISTEQSSPSGESGRRKDRLLPWIAAERAVRGALLIALGIALLSHPHANWAKDISDLARHLGLDPNSNGIHKVLDKIRHISLSKSATPLKIGGLIVNLAIVAYLLWRIRRESPQRAGTSGAGSPRAR